MSAEPVSRWDHLKNLFSDALVLAPAARPLWIADACGDDLSLRDELLALIDAHERAGDFLAAPAFASPSAASAILAATDPAGVGPDPAVPVRCGAYRIEREIGRGGMGTVYLGTRDDDRFDKRVAIKIVSSGGAHPDLVRRFEAERRILASLDHHNIARLLDAGTTDDGVPFVVMEYVEGESIDAYCSTHHVTLRERLALFGAVCEAVQYSHEHLVVHRDIKVRNILVTPDGVPKLLDFGIARLLEPEEGHPQATRTSLRALTPESASPEQVRGEPVTVGTDVYSLGVLLYRLLTDRSPYRGDMKSESDIVRAVCEEEPLRPSDAVVSDRSRRRELRGELDSITLKALRKDRTRRYATVEQLSGDVARYLEGRPVLARPDSIRYRTGKFVTRHKAGVAASAVMLVALVGSLIATAWEAHAAHLQQARAERRFNDVRRLANSFLFEFHDAIQDLPGSTKARELVVLRATEYLDSLSSESATDASLQRELAAAYEKVGDVQGLPNFANLGDTPGALQSHRRALALREALAAAAPADPVRQRELATTYHHLSSIMSGMGDARAALNYERRSIATREALFVHVPGAVPDRRSLAISYHRVGEIMAGLGDWPAALDNFRREAATFEALLAENPANSGAQRDVAIAYKKVGAVLEQTGDRTAALVNYRKAVGLDETRARANVNDGLTQLDLSFGYASIGHVMSVDGDNAGALENYRLALALRERVAVADPHDVNARATVDRAHISIGEVLRLMKRPAEALPHFQEAFKSASAGYAADPTNIGAGERLANAQNELARACADLAGVTSDRATALGHWRDALSWSQQGIDILDGYRAKGTLTASGKSYLESLIGVRAASNLALK